MEVVWLANHNAHTYFGLQVLGQLPPDLRELCTEDLPVFHLGLYGPDPLIFSLWTKKISDRLHKRWREESLPDLTDAIQTEAPQPAALLPAISCTTCWTTRFTR